MAIEVDRLVSGTGLFGPAGRRHPVGSHFAGRRVTVRLDRGLLQLVDQACCCVVIQAVVKSAAADGATVPGS